MSAGRTVPTFANPADFGFVSAGNARPESSMNRSEQICAALRTAILERALLPGMKLPEDTLGERFRSSRTIVRQALERLAAEGLVELRRNRGAVVATPRP
jgi:DNA-binding GntR family transcriptional regulator